MSSITAAEPRPRRTTDELRRRLRALPGVVPASLTPPASQGRTEEARIVPATLIEAPLTARKPGGPELWPGPVAFLDGIQRFEVVAYVNTMPLVVAETAAAVRERIDRECRTVAVEQRRVVIGRPEALVRAGSALDGCETLAISTEEPAHPIRDLDLARAITDRLRGEVERLAAKHYRDNSNHWLVVDGSLSESPSWANDRRMIGVSKSHATLPFDGPELTAYLHLPAGFRSSVFQPASREWAPVYAWGLRLWDWIGKDLFYGLIRVEAAPTEENLAQADRISRWVLAERAPISADPRWDRLLYGIYGIEQFLRARFR